MNIRCCSGCGRMEGEGLRILDILLCPECEAAIVATDVHHWNYSYWSSLFRKVWDKISDHLDDNE